MHRLIVTILLLAALSMPAVAANASSRTAGVPQPETRWEIAVSSETSFEEPSVVDGVMYLLDGTRLRAIDAETGRELWGRRVSTQFSVIREIQHGVVYLLDRGLDQYGDEFIALRAKTGEEVWRFRLCDGRTIRSLQQLPNDLWVAASAVRQEGDIVRSTIFAISETTGKLRWQFPDATWVGITTDQTRVFATHENGALALDAETGAVIWRAELGPGFHDPSASAGTVFFWDQQNGLHAVEGRTGARLWTWTPGLEGIFDCYIQDPVYFVTTSEGSVVIVGCVIREDADGNSRRPIFVIDADSGVEQWRIADNPNSLRTIVGDTLILDGADGRDGAIAARTIANGDPRWSYEPVDAGLSWSESAGAFLIVESIRYPEYNQDWASIITGLDPVSGRALWRIMTATERPLTHVVDGRLFVADDRLMFELDLATGARKWQYDRGDISPDANPPAPNVIAGDRSVFVLTERDTLIALDVPSSRHHRAPAGQRAAP